MWAFQLTAPGHVERVEVPDDLGPLRPGWVTLNTSLVGLCGSDMPRFTGLVGQHGGSFDGGEAPVHELVGTVLESTSDRFSPGDRVVGTLPTTAGLREVVRVEADRLIGVPTELSDVEAIVIQPVSTVVRAVTDQLPPVAGRRAAVIGAGPCGLAFGHVLRDRGASHIQLIDPIERAATAKAFGADEFVHGTSAEWLARLDEESRPSLVVEAVGHQQQTIADAIRGIASGGFVFGFGAPDDADYALPYGEIYFRDLTVASGRTMGRWPEVLAAGSEYVLSHRKEFASYVSHVVSIAEVQHAYELYAHPQEGRLKVVIVV